MANIAISYRRSDSQALTGRIVDRLSLHYGKEKVFMDIDNIPLGIDFRKHIGKLLGECEVLIAVIGPKWTGEENQTDRIKDENDWVRLEVETALERDIPVIPVLIEGAEMPKKSDLPDGLQELVYRHALRVDSAQDFHTHVDRLIRSLDQLLKVPAPGAEGQGSAVAPTAAPAVPAQIAPEGVRKKGPLAVALLSVLGLAYLVPLGLSASLGRTLDPVTLVLAALGLIVIAASLAMLLRRPSSDGRAFLRKVRGSVVAVIGMLVLGFIVFQFVDAGMRVERFPSPPLLIGLVLVSLAFVAIGGTLLLRRPPPNADNG